MNQRERFKRVFDFQKVDMIPNIEIGPWVETFNGWKMHGLPAGINYGPPENDLRYSRHSREMCAYFGLDAHLAKIVSFGDETEPAPSSKVIAEDNETKTIRYSNGYVIRCMKSNEGIFHELDWPVKTRNDWEHIKGFIFPGWHRITGKAPGNLPGDDRDFAVLLDIPGYFWEMRRWMGFERTCTVFYDEPDFAAEMIDFWTDYLLEQCKLLLNRVTPDFVLITEDMAYKTGPMISPDMLRRFMAPGYERLAGFLNSKGVSIVGIESDGLVDEMIPVLHDVGINLWSPFEKQCREDADDLTVLAGKYPWLRMTGGVDKRVLNMDRHAIDKELAGIRPLVARSGYIPHLDHSIPPCPLDNYKYYLEEKAKILECP